MVGLRDVKKARTRAHISEVATALFLQRGFDAVTITEVAEAAEVSKMTVFNHFPRKEDMLLDREPEAHALLIEAVRSRPAGVSPLRALRDLAVDLAEQQHPLSGVAEHVEPLLRLVRRSPALVARGRELLGDLERVLAGLLIEATGLDPDSATAEPARLEAATVIASYRIVCAGSLTRILAGTAPHDLVDDHVLRLHRAFDALEAAHRRLFPAAAPDNPADGGA